VGPFHGQISLDELREQRPDAVAHILWEPVAEITPHRAVAAAARWTAPIPA
jgi:hypothetical protein